MSQPQPTPTEQPMIMDLVIHDLILRTDLGLRTYGTALQPFNGRDALRDLYEELLDACQYIRQVMYERDHPEGD